MGIAPYKYFTFDGVSSRNYDVYLTGTGVFNAPQRAVELLEIPGRNGNYALDQGRFNNITVTYKAGIVDYSESNFADKVSALRNWLCSKVGYKRLEDDYNPNEYRMAVFANGINVDHEDLRTGEFEITFECKPQRWLTSGETATAVANNGTLSNPTLFDSEPLLAVKGYGTIGFNGYEVEIENVPIGDIILYGGGTSNSIVIDETNLNNGDTITINGKQNDAHIKAECTQSMAVHIVYMSLSCSNSDFSVTYGGHSVNSKYRHNFHIITSFPSFSVVCGTDSSVTNTVSGTLTSVAYPSDVTFTLSYTQTISYTASTHTVSYATSAISVSANKAWCTPTLVSGSATYTDIIGDSTKSAVTDTVYIDCDIGECWTIQNGNIVSLNGVISLGSDLPKLSSGTNTFTYDNTVTQLEVQPRWWKI